MKRFFTITLIIFAVAMILRFTHWPGTALFLIVSVVLLLVHALILAFKNRRDKLPVTIFHFTAFLWTVYLLFRIQHWDYYSWYVLSLFVLTSITWIAITIAELKQFRSPQIWLSVYIAFNISLAFIPPHYIYYLYNLNTVFYGNSRDDNFHAWDKYSWFLYQDQQYEAAMAANQKAAFALEKVKRFMELADYHDADDEIAQFETDVANHRQMIFEKIIEER